MVFFGYPKEADVGKAARNEQKKLAATLINGVAIALAATTVIAVGTRLLLTPGWAVCASAMGIVVVLHVLARCILTRLEG